MLAEVSGTVFCHVFLHLRALNFYHRTGFKCESKNCSLRVFPEIIIFKQQYPNVANSRSYATNAKCNLLKIPKTQSFNYAFKTHPTVATSTSAVKWYKSRAHILFLSQVIIIMWQLMNSRQMQVLCQLNVNYSGTSYNRHSEIRTASLQRTGNVPRLTLP